MADDKKILLPNVVPVKLLADELNVSPSEVIKKLIQSGVLATINESVDFDTAAIIADEFGYVAEIESSAEPESISSDEGKGKKKKFKLRPPVVTVMGHVDHGKTKLLDAIRSTNVIDTESGGITQHIGAYQTSIEIEENGKKQKRLVTFLDTPGHEAFSAMRAHGANITDMVILVVAADEGVKPQTIEAISHARAAKVPIIVAINKIDKPEADPDRVKRELSDQKLIPEEWGGKTPMVPVSATTGKNIDGLLEVVALTADIEDLKVSYDSPAKATVIESKILPGKGAVATAIIREGTLRPTDTVVYGDEFAKIRFIEDWHGGRVKEAGPSDPILIAGFKKVPKVGITLTVVKDEKSAKEITEKLKKSGLVKTIAKPIGLGEVSKEASEGKLKELNLIVKADMKGSLEAIKSSLEEISSEGIQLKIIFDGVGTITESDINLAVASKAVVLAFRVPVPPLVLKLADSKGIKISRYEIIYQLIDEVVAALEGMLEPEIVETEIGQIEVIKQFFKDKEGGVVGGKVISGKVTPGTKIEVMRGIKKIADLKTESVQIGQEKVNKATKGMECGVKYKGGSIRFRPKDILKFILVEEHLKTVKRRV